jgi:hypothetical protein
MHRVLTRTAVVILMRLIFSYFLLASNLEISRGSFTGFFPTEKLPSGLDTVCWFQFESLSKKHKNFYFPTPAAQPDS